MAVGDQIHWAGDGSGDIRPSSGVEMIIKTLSGGFRNTSNYFHFYHRSSSNNYWSYALIAGATVDSYSKSPGGNYVGAGGGTEGHKQVNLTVPMNNSHWIYAQETGSSHYGVSGYITKQ